jgi:hypothetical protein
MSVFLKYCIRVVVDGFANRQVIEQAPNIAFLQQRLGQLDESQQAPKDIQSVLMQCWQENFNSTDAESCLRCFVSHQVEYLCVQLEDKFGKQHDFTSAELLPYVLDSVREGVICNSSSLVTRVLDTFDPSKGSLSTWTIRIFKSDVNIKRILREHGIEQITNWMILSYMKPGRLQSILKEQRTETEVQQALQLLESFHEVYCTQLWQQRKTGTRSRYPEPTLEQLLQIARKLVPTVTPEEVLEQLQNLGNLLRQERLRRSKTDNKTKATKSKVNDSSNDFTSIPQFDVCLTGAVKQVIEARIIYLQGKKTSKSLQKAENFITALDFFHCQGVPMKEIAPQLDLLDQPTVSRLLELKSLRSDIASAILRCLQEYILEYAKSRYNLDALQEVEAKVQATFGDDIKFLTEEAKKEANDAKARVKTSRLARKICSYLDNRRS